MANYGQVVGGLGLAATASTIISIPALAALATLAGVVIAAQGFFSGEK